MTEITRDSEGLAQSSIPFGLRGLPTKAIAQIATLMQGKAMTHGRNAWRDIPAVSHLDHAFYHLMRYSQCAMDEDHVLHAACRLLMALELSIEETETYYKDAGINE